MSYNNDDLFGGFFDLDGDGKTSISEEYLAYLAVTGDDSFDEDNAVKKPAGHIVNASCSAAPEQPDTVQPKKVEEVNLDVQSYNEQRQKHISYIFRSLTLGIFLSVLDIVGIVGCSLILSNASASDTDMTLIGLQVIGLFILIIVIISGFYRKISRTIVKLRELKDGYIATLPEDESVKVTLEEKKKKKKTVIAVCAVVGAIIVLCVAVGILCHVHTSSVYANAEALIYSCEYEKALDQLEGIKKNGYKDTASLIVL